MADKLFFSQQLIDSWCDVEKVKFDADTLYIQGAKGAQEFDLVQAFRVLKVSDGTSDPHSIVGKVLSGDDLREKGADVYLDSCIIGETPYDLEAGYVAIKTEDEKSLNDLLIEYMLKTMK